MPNYVVAVSGGVDSVVLLGMLATGNLPNSSSQIPIANLIVAHFDHGIRDESAGDAEFVGNLAKEHGLLFETKREELGAGTSEELARDRRYAFLREVAAKHNARIMTAHHADDLVETIAINLVRGTGWRGLAVLDSPDIDRPLLGMTKLEIKNYAEKHRLDWREDVTNNDTKYLRNDLRKKMTTLDPQMRQLLGLYRNRQVVLRKEIDSESSRIVGDSPYARHLIIYSPNDAAEELLRAIVVRDSGYYPTRPQLRHALHAVKVLHGGKRYEIASGVALMFTTTHFVIVKS